MTSLGYVTTLECVRIAMQAVGDYTVDQRIWLANEIVTVVQDRAGEIRGQ